MTGQRILSDKYQIISEIKKGGFGIVYYGRDLQFGKPVAIKEINPSLLDKARYIDLFQAEARTAAQLNHPNIAHIYELSREEDGSFYIVMEYIDGGDLSAVLRKCHEFNIHFPANLAAFVVSEMCNALDYAYNRKNPETGEPGHLVHQDICPSNIMLAKDGRVKLIDFGIAGVKFRQMVKEKNAVVVAGKLPYMAPEQMDSNFTPNKNSDIFSLGAVFYEILTGRRAFPQTDTNELVDNIRRVRLDTDYLRELGVPVEMQKIVLHAMQKQPEKRYATAGEMRQEIHNLLDRTSGRHDLGDDLAKWIKGLFPETEKQIQKTRVTAPEPQEPIDEDFAGEFDLESFYEPTAEIEPSQDDTVLENSQRADKTGVQASAEKKTDEEILTAPESSSRSFVFKKQTSTLPAVSEEESEDELKTIIDVVRLSARSHKKAIFGTLITLLFLFLTFTGLDTGFQWTNYGANIHDFIFPPAIKIITVPAGAQIFLDDKDLQVKSPASIPRIAIGVHKLTLRIAGYPDVIRSIQVPGKGILTIVGEKAHGTREPYFFRFQSRINFVSNPPGAFVYLNDIKYSQPTPCEVTWDVGVPLNIKMEKPGFDVLAGISLDLSEEIEQIDDRRVWHFSKTTDVYKSYTVEGTFRKRVLVNSMPSGAEIFVDNEPNPIGLTGYQSDVLLPLGRHEFILKKEGYIPRRIVVDVNENGPNEVTEALYRTVRFFAKDINDTAGNELGAFIVQLSRSGQTIQRNDVTPCEIALGPYVYKIVFRKPGYKDTEVKVTPDKRAVVARLEPALVNVVVQVVDALAGVPINKALVSYKNLQNPSSEERYFAMTDVNGRCSSPLPPGQYSFKVKKFGYRESVQNFQSHINSDNTVTFNLVLM